MLGVMRSEFVFDECVTEAGNLRCRPSGEWWVLVEWGEWVEDDYHP